MCFRSVRWRHEQTLEVSRLIATWEARVDAAGGGSDLQELAQPQLVAKCARRDASRDDATRSTFRGCAEASAVYWTWILVEETADKMLSTTKHTCVGLARFLVILILGAGAVPVPELMAQANPDSVHLRNDCRLATQILRTGNPANKQEWALGIISWCGRDGVDAFAAVWRNAENTGDSLVLANLMHSVFQIRDAVLFEILLSTAESPTSSVRARVEAWYYLLQQVGRGIVLPAAELLGGPSRRLCTFDYSTSMRPIEGRPLPADFVTRIDAAAVEASASGTDPKIRRFGKCVHDYIRTLSIQAP